VIHIKRVIIINGLPQSGKDTFVNLCGNYAKVVNFSSVDFVKDVAEYAGWDGKKTDKSRLFLSELKRLMAYLDDIPYKKVKEAVRDFRKSDNELLFVHIREPEEISRAVKDFNALSVFVSRAGNTQIVSNDSDKYVASYNSYDFTLNNDSDLEALDRKAKGFVTYLRSKDYD